LNEANAIVVLFAGALGDFVLALPALRLLRRHAGMPLVLAVRRPLAGLAERAGCAEQVAAMDDHAMAVFLGGGVPPPWWPGRPRLVSWFGADDAAIRMRLGACSADAVFRRVERGEGARHAAAAYAASVGEVPPWAELVALGALPASAPAWAGEVKHHLVLHRGAGAAAKRWSAAAFAEVAAWWRQRGGEVTELLGPAEAAMEALPGVDARRDLSLVAMTEVLAQAHAYVGNDSGPSHVAGALGLAGVVLFGPTDPARWRPLSLRLEAVRAQPATRGPNGFTDPPAATVIRCLERALP
jgi:ADP-heptose:LPS heptosyltransferase